MARGIGENPARSPAEHVRQVEYPASREDIVQTAADNEAPVEVINFLKSLPKERYESYEAVLRDAPSHPPVRRRRACILGLG